MAGAAQTAVVAVMAPTRCPEPPLEDSECGFPLPSSVPAAVHSSFPAISAKAESRWYTRRLCMDEDGDVADGFLSEVTTEVLPNENQTTPYKLHKVQHSVYYHGRKESGHCCRWEYTSAYRVPGKIAMDLMVRNQYLER